MNIEYLKSYDREKDRLDQYRHRSYNAEGKSMEEIQHLEGIFNNGKPFPKAFREYLYIGGKYNAIGFEDGVDGNFEGLMDSFLPKLKQRGLTIDRPFIIYHTHDNKAFSFIYLDEGDDPQPWNASISEAYDNDDDEQIWKVPFPSFSSFVDSFIQDLTNNLSAW